MFVRINPELALIFWVLAGAIQGFIGWNCVPRVPTILRFCPGLRFSEPKRK